MRLSVETMDPDGSPVPRAGLVEAARRLRDLAAAQSSAHESAVEAAETFVLESGEVGVTAPMAIGEEEGGSAALAEAGRPGVRLEALVELRRSAPDGARPEAVAKQRRRGAPTARERIDALRDPGSFCGIGDLVLHERLGLSAPGDSLVVGTASIEGRPVALLAKDFTVFGGSVWHPGGTKHARIVRLALRHGMPMVMLLDGGGHRIEDGRNVRAYGLGYYAISGGRSFDADACFAWPTAEICAMSVEGSVDVAYRKDYEAADEPGKRRQEIIDSIRARIGPLQAEEGFGIDDPIDPRTTRHRLIEALRRAPARRDIGMPPKFRSISPI